MCARPKSNVPSVLGFKILKYIADNGPAYQSGLATVLSRLERRQINRDTIHRSWKRLAALGYLDEYHNGGTDGDDGKDDKEKDKRDNYDGKGPPRMYGRLTDEGKKILKKFLRENA